MDMFHACAPSLKVLFITGAYLSTFLHTGVALPVLQELVISDASLNAVQQLPRGMLPSLKILCFSDMFPIPSVPVEAVSVAFNHLSREGVRLEQLALDVDTIS
ncbi:hypothetical protein EXIGLDRAFT_759426 [Exidia glandulosa HHB12029]|uniref:F-box domain-containing protein n=1 Tax=Exidia glandulosa HHB12029 TaxID=1314781 RepID=A0A165Q5U0_EXIGL|nr:hypothetical protein EXIGLDRAFT_759426 [Exidia glandulosa HHB12029]